MDSDLDALARRTIDEAAHADRRQEDDRRERGQPKVACPKCASWMSDVKDGRADPRGYKRTRKCRDCGHRFQTFEKAA